MKIERKDSASHYRMLLLSVTALIVVAFAGACGSSKAIKPAVLESSDVSIAAVDEAVASDADMVNMEMPADDDMTAMDMSASDDVEATETERDPFIRRPIDRQAAGFTLTDQNNESVSLQDFRGRWVVIDWIYTSCMTVCPALTGEMLEVRDALGDRFGQQVGFMSLTFDPGRDSVEEMRKYAENVNANTDSWAWLTGTKAETDNVAQAFGVSYTPAEAMMGVAMFDHTALTIVIDPRGVERFHYYGVGWSDDMISTLDELVPAEPEARVAGTLGNDNVLSGLSVKAAAMLADSTSYYWEDWELEEGITGQSVHNFSGTISTKRYFMERMNGLEENGWTNLGKEDEEGEALGLYYMFQISDTDYIGVGTDGNVMVEVRGKGFGKTLDELFWLGGALCCPA